MQKHTKPPNFQSFDSIIANWPDNTAEHQRGRLLDAMRLFTGITTLEATRFLDIIDPRARVVELRKEGYSIVTSWVSQPSECGRLHNVGLYTLACNENAIEVGMKGNSMSKAVGNQMVLALWH
ncbi:MULTISPECIES: helix-turn-helix domain-containing protein [unclassified Caballeronia]|uniref:helix-turn-helix domain-containing protein n=1 Tax=unclassified Caballeronia TaxID=2646786 RepID=UPI001F2C7B52|nr:MULTISPECIES: helix-turn-helix domain-containing protein [unclassified Caballeronia]MCE4543040.1 helix-turn-helix domain-containing protein [Caballeronia sp. PC1]MCE4567904.1 helix-turn-helix domain-containing protein [Caballeronia sp. CLC5]